MSGGKQSTRILTPTDFLASVDEGTVLYVQHSWNAKPSSIERITVTRVERDDKAPEGIYGREPELICHYISAHGSQTRMYVTDMLNRWHGAWTDLQEALEYFRERQTAYETDPELIAEHKESMQRFCRFERMGGY